MKALSQEFFLSNELRYLIDHRNLQPGDKLPSERELCTIFNCQRLAIRTALQMLEQEKLIYSQPKSGYFVDKKRIEKNVMSIPTVMESIPKNVESSMKLIKFLDVEANKYVSRETSLPLGTHLYEIKLLRLVNDEPVCVDYAYVPVRLVPDLDQYDFEKEQLYSILRNDYHISLTSGIQKIRVIEVEEAYRELLRLNVDDHVVLQTGSVFDEHGSFAAFIESYINYDRFSYVLH